MLIPILSEVAHIQLEHSLGAVALHLLDPVVTLAPLGIFGRFAPGSMAINLCAISSEFFSLPLADMGWAEAP